MNVHGNYTKIPGEIVIILSVILVMIPVLLNPVFSPDDYRYLGQMKSILDNPFENIMDLFIIENSWQHLWWHNSDSIIRFFRFPVLSAYLITYIVWDSNPLGYALTALIIHIICSILVLKIFKILFEDRKIAFYTALLFAIHPVHGEALWYFPGVTDSLAALFWLMAFYHHIKPSGNNGLTTLIFFFLALLSKENSITLILIILVYDLIYNGWKNFKRILIKKYHYYLGFLVMLFIYYILRLMIIGSILPDTHVYPYFYTPERTGFILHVLVMITLYLINLFFGYHTTPFYLSDTLFIEKITSLNSPLILLIPICIFFSFIFLKNEKRYWFLVLFFIITLLPSLIVYTSERFIYLSSISFFGILIFFIQRFLGIKAFNNKAGLAMIIFFFLLYSSYLTVENILLPKALNTIVTDFDSIHDSYAQAIEDGFTQDNFYIINYPDHLTKILFIDEILNYNTGIMYNPHILTIGVNISSEHLLIEKMSAKAIRISSFTPLFYNNHLGFKTKNLNEGDVIKMPSYTVTIMEASRDGPLTMRFDFEQPVDDNLFLIYDPSINTFTRINPG